MGYSGLYSAVQGCFEPYWAYWCVLGCPCGPGGPVGPGDIGDLGGPGVPDGKSVQGDPYGWLE